MAECFVSAADYAKYWEAEEAKRPALFLATFEALARQLRALGELEPDPELEDDRPACTCWIGRGNGWAPDRARCSRHNDGAIEDRARQTIEAAGLPICSGFTGPLATGEPCPRHCPCHD